jgi:retinol dehydrogenase-14
LDLEDPEFLKRPFSGVSAYSQAKQANRMLSWALAARLEGSGVTVNAMSPGFVRTQLNRDAQGFLRFVFSMMGPLMGKTPAEGADTAIWLASSPELQGVNGKFWEKRKEVPCKFRQDPEALKRLEGICLQRVGLRVA